MAEKTSQFDTSFNSGDYFFVGGIFDETFTSGRNSFTVNSSAKVKERITANNIKIFDSSGNKLQVFNLIPAGSTGYQYSEGKSQVFGVLVYPETPSGVGRIEITASALATEVTGSIGLSLDARWISGQYTNSGTVSPIKITWSKPINFNSSLQNKSTVRFFDSPKLETNTEIYDVKIRSGCSATSVIGSCSSVASIPADGQSADFNYNIIPVKYIINRISGDVFDSSMNGSYIRFTNIESTNSTINVDVVSKIESVLTENSLLLEKPITISKPVLSGATSKDVPYIEETGTTIKKYESFNETDMYSTTAKSSGIQSEQNKQVYNVGFSGISHRKNYTIVNIKSANFEIVYSPRTTSMISSGLSYITPSGAQFNRKVCLLKLYLSDLRTLTGAISRYRVIKKSLNFPESEHCISEGPLLPSELIFDWFAGEYYSNLGRFCDLSITQLYWLCTSGISYEHTPKDLIDSITIHSDGTSNIDESKYVILKNNRGEPGRTVSYVPYIISDGSWWATNSNKFVNFSTEPTTSYDCSFMSPYINSIEVVKSGSIFNSNFVQLTKNTMYEFSMEYSNLTNTNSTDYSFDVYFCTTNNGTPEKIKIGSLNDKSTRKFSSGKYSNKLFVQRQMFGTIQLIPKYVTSISIANVSFKQFTDIAYPLDSAIITTPLSVKVKNENIEITVELLDLDGKLVHGENSPSFSNNIALKPLKSTVVADPHWFTLEAYDRS